MLLLAALCCAVSVASAGESTTEPVAERPTVALVLSGGGAKGLAHLGVIKVLEELQVPVDMVIGTSMGAIVGGLYVSGWEPRALERAVEGMDWATAFRDRTERRGVAFRRKQDERDLPGQLTLGLRGDGVALPRGFIQGQQLSQALRRFAESTLHVQHFDDFPVRYRALAVDLMTGEVVVLADGNLPEAMRASMSIPGLIAPVEWNERLLIDGGIQDNIPIQVARDMGADVVIAVDVGGEALSDGELDNPFAVMDQSLNIMMRTRSAEQIATLGDNDILIRPDLLGIPVDSADFHRSAEATVAGELAARQQLQALTRLSVDAESYALWQQRLRDQQRPGQRMDFVRINNRSGIADEIIRARLPDIEGRPLDVDAMEAAMDRIHGLEYFERTDYRIVSDGDRTGVEVTTVGKSWGPGYLRVGLALEDDLDTDASYLASVSYLQTEVNRLGAEWRVDAQIGSRPRLFGEFWQPFGYATRYFVAPRAEAYREAVPVYTDGDQSGEVRVNRQLLGLHGGRELGAIGEVRVGMERGAGRVKPLVTGPGTDRFTFSTAEGFVSLALDTLDNPRFPTRGMVTEMSWTRSVGDLGADQRYGRAELDWLMASSFGRHTVLTGLRYATVTEGEIPVYSLYSLGGFLNLSGYQQNELTGDRLALGRLIYFRRMGGGQQLAGFPTYLGGSLEVGNVWDQDATARASDLIYSGSLLLGLDLPVGMVYLAYGRADGRDGNIYLTLGRTF
ncbi:MAG: patatin-like phospholipase family protein [Ectothiorhodospiraceae bacterium]|nr:patatin-like phospholipase family protein [Ectothiorhodospiraceae bacterium]